MKTRVDAKNQPTCELEEPRIMTRRHTDHGDTHGDRQKQDIEETAKVESGEDCLDQVAAGGKYEVADTIFEHHLAKTSLIAPPPELNHGKQRDKEVKAHGYYM